MRTKKKLSTTKQAIVKRHEELPPRSSKQLSTMKNLGSTKTWLRETSRCKASEDKLQLCPHLYHLDDSPNNPSESGIDTLPCHILSSRLDKMPSKFAPINFVPRKLIALNRYVNRCPTRLELGGVASSALMFYRTSWFIFKDHHKVKHEQSLTTLTKYVCRTVDPFDAKGKCMQFTSIVLLEGVILGLSLQGALVVMEEIDSRFTITAISKSRVVPSVSWRFFKEYLVELNGEILLVFLNHQETVRVVDKVEVFRLSSPDLKWIKVERIQGNKTLFLDHECRIYVSSTEIDGKENWIYFTQGPNNCWWKYDMGRDCISLA